LSEYKIATIDIETFPNVGFAWEEINKYPERRNLIAVDQPWVAAAFAVKWEGDSGPPQGWGLPHFKKTYKNNPFDDSVLLDRMYNVLEDAHLVTGHNIDSFDIRKINAKVVQAGLPPPIPPKTFDTLKLARQKFLLPSYSLKSIADWLGCPFNKHDTDFKLWLSCMGGDMEAWEEFVEYNVQDVRVSEWVYHRLRPWSSSHPNITILGDESNLCPVCGYKTKLLEDNPGPLKSFLVERWRCQRKSCGKTSFGQRKKLDIKVLSA
jgi:RNase_H superfamily